MNEYDVVVVGGRVAGAATAMLLSRAGLRVALFERSRSGSDTLSTHALMRGGVLQLSRWGLLSPLLRAGTPAIHSTTFHYGDDRTTRVSIRPSPGVDALYAPRRHLLDRVLVEAAAASGADVHHATPVLGLLRAEDGRVHGVRVSGRDAREVPVRAALTVGADGIGSLVAREVGAPVVLQGRAASALLYRYVADLAADGYSWGYGDAVGAGLIPTNDAETCVFVSTTPSRMKQLRRAGVESAFDSLLAATPPAIRDAVRAGGTHGELHGWRGVPGFVRRPFGPGWALVGDAGYFKDPITTHGLTDALRDAELLADAVTRTSAGTPASVAFAEYENTRDRLSGALAEVTEAVCRYDWSEDEIQALLRRVSSAMSDEVDHLTARLQRRLDPQRPRISAEPPGARAGVS
jgi:flavin-dependent dehydrogenase